MLDWPEPSQTSPMRTSFTVIEFFPERVISKGPPGLRWERRTTHLPSAPATADFVCFLKVTVTFSPGSAVPHTGTDMPLWRTMWSLNSEEGFTSASVVAANDSMAQQERTWRYLFIRSQL